MIWILNCLDWQGMFSLFIKNGNIAVLPRSAGLAEVATAAVNSAKLDAATPASIAFDFAVPFRILSFYVTILRIVQSFLRL
jgi:hypothetical protein